MDQFFFTYTAALLALSFWVGAAVLIYAGKLDALKKQFILFLFFGGLWIGSNAVADVALTHDLVANASGFAFIGGTFLITMYLIFIDTFIDERLPSHWRLAIYIVPSIAFSIGGFTEFATVDTILIPGQPSQLIPGPQYTISTYWFIGSFIYGMTRLALAVRRSVGNKKMQTAYIAIGFGGLIFGITTFSVILPLLGELRFFNVAPQFAFIFALATGYAIIKHNLLDIRVVIQRGLIYTILFAFITVLYIGLLTFSALIFDARYSLDNFFSGLIVIIIGIFSVPRLDKYLRQKTDLWFFKDNYEYTAALYGLSQTLQSSLELDSLLDRSEQRLAEILRADFVHILPEKAGTGSSPSDLVVPIKLNQKLTGLIIVGPKKSGDPYTEQDRDLLTTFANQAAVAMSRTFLYQEIKRHADELEQKVTERTTELQIAQEKQRSMMLHISHNLQTPLAILKTKIEHLKKTDPTVAAQNLERTLDNTSQFITDLLTLARLEGGHETLSLTTFNLSRFLADIEEEIQIIAADHGIAITPDIATNVSITSDEQRLREVIMNLLSNAIKYIGDTAPKEIKIGLAVKTTDTAVITIADTGIGIPESDLETIFSDFSRGQNQTQATGTGLGLAITQEIVYLLNGTITVASTVGTGSVFTITLPLTPAGTT